MSRPGIGSAPNPNADPNAKDKFKNLDANYKDAVAQSSPEEIYKRIADIEGQLEALDAAKQLDQDLLTAKDRLATAQAPYKEQAKDLKLRIKYAVRVLGDKGKL
jgi:hypothetical protein